jgi:hypothetical protein
MKDLIRFFALGCSAAISTASGTAQTWETVLDYQFATGKSADGHGIAADSLGNVFTGGGAYDSFTNTHGIVLQTDTAQLANASPINWLLSDDTNPNATQNQSNVQAMGLDVSQDVYSVGTLTPKCSSCPVSSPIWYVRKSSDSGASWSTVDAYQYAAGQLNFALGFTADQSGAIYVVGYGNDAGTKKNSGNNHWLVRMSTDGAQTWTLVDDVIYATAHGAGFAPSAGVFVVGQNASTGWLVRRSPTGRVGTWTTVDNPFAGAATSVCVASSGSIYVAGNAYIITQTKPYVHGYYLWTIRKSTDGGSHWSTVDAFAYAQGANSYVYGLGTDALGNAVAVGNAYDGQQTHWMVRKPGTSGAWVTIDDFQLAPGYSAYAAGITTDSAGHLLVTGNAWDAPGAHWIVRRL